MKMTVEPGQALEATPVPSKRITGKRTKQATPMPVASPQEGEDDVKKGRQLFKDEDLQGSTSSALYQEPCM